MTLQELLDNLAGSAHPVEAMEEFQAFMADKDRTKIVFKRIERAIAGVNQAYVGLAAALAETLDVKVEWLSDFDGSAERLAIEATKAALVAAESADAT